MAIKRFTADADNTISNAFKTDLITRATGSNMGESDILEIFSIYGQASGSGEVGTLLGYSSELQRCLVKFPISSVIDARNKGDLPQSGSVNFYFKMFNARHSQQLARKFNLVVSAVSSSWDEGLGLDMEDYSDLTHGITGSNWLSASNDSSWVTPGGDYHDSPKSTAYFERGTENLEVNVSQIVEDWITGGSSGGKYNYGFGIQITSSQEAFYSSSSGNNSGSVLHNPNGSKYSFYTKKFFARNSEFYNKRPVLEARWDSSRKDNRGNFYYSSSLSPAVENLNTLYLYNYVRGTLRDIPEIKTGSIYVQIFSGNLQNTIPSTFALTPSSDGVNVMSTLPTVITGGHVATGIYSASFALTASSPSLTTLFDVWYTGSAASPYPTYDGIYHTGSIIPKTLSTQTYNTDLRYVTKIINLKSNYTDQETARFRLFTRKKKWNPNIYSVATSEIENDIIESGSYKVYRVVDGLDIINYGTGSDLHTQISYDISGSYFDLDMSNFERDYAYGIKFVYYLNGSWVEQPETFKFRVE